VRAILGQQVSVAGARTLTGRLVAAFGDDLSSKDNAAPARLFPTATRLAEADVASLGMPVKRADAIRELSRAVAAGEIDLTPTADGDATRAALVAIPGVGPWTASYVAMRALRDPDAFLPGDLGVRKAMARLGVGDSPAAIERRASAWRPWRSYALQHLWASL
jgi:AraC family transcriptional regulator of adaptative response / DNA-3-methyladenine glycosylase II